MPADRRRAGWALFLAALLLLVGPSLYRLAAFYRSRPAPREVTRPDLAHALAAPPAGVESAVVESETPEQRGLVLIDQAHRNHVQPDELTLLVGHILARGWRVQFHDRDEELLAALARAQALVVAAPRRAFGVKEQDRIGRFVEAGGHLLLLGDPARVRDPSELNSLAQQFDLVAYSDYLYNQRENAGNFRYVYFADFAASPITEGLERVVLYDTHSVGGPGPPLIRGDEATLSSQREGAGLPAAAVDPSRRVLLIGDLTFLREPFASREDNARLVRNLARFLTSAQRQFELADFPWLPGGPVSVVYQGGDLLPLASRLAGLLQGRGLEVSLAAWSELGASGLPTGPLLLVATFEASQKLGAWWEDGGLAAQVGLPAGDLDREGTALVHLRTSQDGPVVSVVGHDVESLFDLVEALEQGKLEELMVSSRLALLVPEKPKEKKTPTATPEEGEAEATPTDEVTPTPAEPTATPTEPTATPGPEATPTPTPTPEATPTPESHLTAPLESATS